MFDCSLSKIHADEALLALFYHNHTLTHIRSDWHRYNLKRKVAGLGPMSADAFRERVIAQQSESAAAAASEALAKQVRSVVLSC